MVQRTSVIDPRRTYPKNYQFTARDYVSVPTIMTHGTWPLAELAHFNLDTATVGNVELFITAFEKQRSSLPTVLHFGS